MSSLNTKDRADFDEWLNSIDDSELRHFVFFPLNEEVNFGSEDFKLVNYGLSTGEPVGCRMIEARISFQTKKKQLRRLFNVSGSLGRDPSRLAFALIPDSMFEFIEGKYVRQALQESPVEGESILNKIHVQFSANVELVDDDALVTDGTEPFVFNKIPVAGFNVDGSKVKAKTKKGKGKK